MKAALDCFLSSDEVAALAPRDEATGGTAYPACAWGRVLVTAAVSARRESVGETKVTTMKTPSDMILAELGDVKQIVHAACTVESAIRGEPVSPHDPRVQYRAAEIILSVGAELRAAVENQQRTDQPRADCRL